MNSLFVLRFPDEGYFRDFYLFLGNYGVLINFFYLGALYFGFLQAAFVFLMTLNRFSAVILHMQYKKVCPLDFPTNNVSGVDPIELIYCIRRHLYSSHYLDLPVFRTNYGISTEG